MTSFHFLYVEIDQNRRLLGSHGAAMLLSVVTFVVLEVGGGNALVQQITDLFQGEVDSMVQGTVLHQSFLDGFYRFGCGYACKG